MLLGRNFVVSPYGQSFFFLLTTNFSNLLKTTTRPGQGNPLQRLLLLLFGVHMKIQMQLAITEETGSFPSLPLGGKDEMNFAEFPIALLTDRVPKDQKIIKFEDEIFDEKRKRVMTRRRIIEGSEEYGLPTATDDLVILALIQLTKLQGDFTKREVEFTRLELIKLLGWPNEGKSYDRIKLSLLRIQSVNYVYDNAWWDSRQKLWTTKAFHIIDNVEINDSRASAGQGGLFPSRIVWNEVVFDSFQAGFLRDIDFQLCMRLEHPTALRMYRFLGKRFYVRPEWMFDLKEFAYEHMGLGRNYEGGTQIARKLKPAIAELEAVGFLERLPEDKRFIKKGRNWAVRFLQKNTAPAILPESFPQTEPPPSALAAVLTSHGVTPKTAAELVAKHQAEFIQLKIDVFDWLLEKQDKRIAKSPAGYLVKSITDDYKAPKGFESAANRQRKQEAKDAKARQDAEDRHRKREADARDRAEKKDILDHWESLTPEQQGELQAAADAQADPAELAQQTGPLKSMGQTIRRHEYIRQLLRSRQTDAAEA